MEGNKKIILVSFATTDLKRSIKRFETQAIKSNFYKKIYIFTPDNLPDQINKKLNHLIKKGKKGEAYNIGSNFEYKNIDIVKIIAKENKKLFLKNIKFIKDRPFNDFRYSVNFNKIKKLGWKPKIKVEDRIQNINNWYIKNIDRFKNRFE